MNRRAIGAVIGAAVIVAMAACGGAGAGTSVSEPDSVGASSSSSGATPGECFDGGPYMVGKGGGYRPCCPGLTEVRTLTKVSSGQPGTLMCGQVPARVYICIKGSCGDGICEAAESQPCACPADCPSAMPDAG